MIKGSILGLVGQSGSGKTTIIRIILGLYNPDKGTIYLNGIISNNRKTKRIGFASQEYSFYPRLTVEENLHFYGDIYNLTKKEIESRIDKLLQIFELNYARKVRSENLSGGMKRRLDIVIALLPNPDVIILDEPTTGLDVVLKEKMWDLIAKINKGGITVIVSSHDLVEIQEHCTDVAFIREGHVFDTEILKEYQKKYKLKSLSDVFKALYIEGK